MLRLAISQEVTRQRVRVSNMVASLVNEYECLYSETPRSLNDGYCAAFAEDLVERLNEAGMLRAIRLDGNDVTNLDEGLHVWTYVGGLHYDSEAPLGVSDWTELPFWRRTRPSPRRNQTVAMEATRTRMTCDFVEKCRRSIQAHRKENKSA